MAQPIYKICERRAWEDAEAKGVFGGLAADQHDGFIHFSTASQLEATVAKHFAGRSDLLLIAVDAEALGNDLRWEPSRGAEPFPHLYGPLDLAAVLSVMPLALGADGRHVFPAGIVA